MSSKSATDIDGTSVGADENGKDVVGASVDGDMSSSSSVILSLFAYRSSSSSIVSLSYGRFWPEWTPPEVKPSKTSSLGSNGSSPDCRSKKSIDSWEDCEFDWLRCCSKAGSGCDGEGSLDGVCEGPVALLPL